MVVNFNNSSDSPVENVIFVRDFVLRANGECRFILKCCNKLCIVVYKWTEYGSLWHSLEKKIHT